jgi:uncharacterized lipoprotein YmbA
VRRQTGREVGHAHGRLLLDAAAVEHLKLVQVGVAEKLSHDGVVEATNDAVVLVRPATWKEKLVRGRLHVYKSVYDSTYDFMHDLQTSQIGIQLFIQLQMSPSIETF